MFEYCLEDAAGYFEIVLNWNKKIPKVTKDMIITESLSYSDSDEQSSAKLIDENIENFSLENCQFTSDQLLGNLTVADLEVLIVKIVEKAFKEEIQKLKYKHLSEKTTQINHLLQVFV